MKGTRGQGIKDNVVIVTKVRGGKGEEGMFEEFVGRQAELWWEETHKSMNWATRGLVRRVKTSGFLRPLYILFKTHYTFCFTWWEETEIDELGDARVGEAGQDVGFCVGRDFAKDLCGIGTLLVGVLVGHL